MARLENVSWNSQALCISMKIRGAICVPEASFAIEVPSRELVSPVHVPVSNSSIQNISPVDSLDSSFMSGPSSSVSDTNAATPNHQLDRFDVYSPRQQWLSHKYLAYGGPSFSIATIDSMTGSSDCIPIPMPNPTSMESVAYDDFSQAEVLSMTIVGASQVWAGTESGSLHIFDVAMDLRSKQPELRFVKHVYTNLNDSALCIVSQQLSIRPPPAGESPERSLGNTPRVEVLLGSPHGNITIITGESDERGALKNALKCPRKVVQLSNFEEEGSPINCITPVSCAGVETYWCGCGSGIVVLRRSDWKELARLDGTYGSPSRPNRKPIQILQLLASECGVWSYTSSSSTISLWDTKKFEPKLHITCCNFCTVDGWVDDFAEIRVLTFSYPLLFVGTNGGHLLVFKILEGSSSPPLLGRSNALPRDLAAINTAQNGSNGSRKSQIDYRILAATHCGAQPIVSIHTSQLQEEIRRSPIDSPIGTPGASMQILVVCGAPNRRNGDREGLSSSQVQLYELVTSPLPSPVVSPAGFSNSRERSISVTSFGSISFRRGSISKIPQKLTLHSASPQSHILLPLTNQ